MSYCLLFQNVAFTLRFYGAVLTTATTGDNVTNLTGSV